MRTMTAGAANTPKTPKEPLSLSTLWDAVVRAKRAMTAPTPLDTTLAAIFLVLVGLGSVMLLSASSVMADHDHGDLYYYFRSHMRNLAVSLALVVLLWRIPYQFWLRFAPAVILVALLMLIAVLVPWFSQEAHGSGRWLKLPFVKIQPSELAKLALAIYLARYYAALGDLRDRITHAVFAPFLLAVLFGGLVYLEVDLGGPLVILAVVVCMLIAGGARPLHMSVFSIFIPVVWYSLPYFKHRMDRIVGWMDPWLVAKGPGFPIIHSFYAFGTGGTTGAGLGQSLQKQYFLPEAHTDYIFSIVGEELGLVGVAGVCLLFFLLAYRGVHIALSAKTLGGGLLAAGMVMCVAIPALIAMMVALSIVPAKGLPLPFFGHGGTSLLVSCATVGILLNISGQTLAAASRRKARGAVEAS
jgi:cell division protein FtsW